MGLNLKRIGLAVATGGTSEAAKKLGLGLNDEQGAYNTPEDQAQQRMRNLSEGGLYGYAQDTFNASKNQQGLYGKGGLQDQLADEQKQLSSQGFNLTQDDHTAYGQVAGDVSRLFGQQEQAATQNLARRGLASASSGAAGAKFSGLAGNKNEMLAAAQTQIAQKRFADTQNRLQQTRSMMGSLAENASNQINRLQTSRLNEMSHASNAETNINAQRSQALADQQAATKPGLFSTIGQGLQAGIGNLATQAPGMVATGGASGASGMGGAEGASGAGGSSMFANVAPGVASSSTKRQANYGNYA